MNGIQSARPHSRKRNPINLSKAPEQPKIQKFRSEQSLKLSDETLLDQDRNQRQLMKEIQLAKMILNNYKNPSAHKRSAKGMNFRQNHLDHLKSLQSIIVSKDHQLKDINEEIKILRSAPDQVRREAVKKYKNIQEAQMFKLADEVGIMRQNLGSLQRTCEKKRNQLDFQKQKMEEVQHQYFEICSVLGKTVLSFQEFSLRKKQKTKNDENSKLKKHFKKPSSSHKTKLQTETSGKNAASMDLKQALNKLDIAEGALKNFRKKHNNEKAELNGKLDFLKEQDEELQDKLRMKLHEFHSTQLRFNETKKIVPKKKFKIKRYSQPQM